MLFIKERYHEIPSPLTTWRTMSVGELETAFDECPEEFQSCVYWFLGRTETNLQWYLGYLEKYLERGPVGQSVIADLVQSRWKVRSNGNAEQTGSPNRSGPQGAEASHGGTQVSRLRPRERAQADQDRLGDR
jgi:hypothetical protein